MAMVRVIYVHLIVWGILVDIVVFFHTHTGTLSLMIPDFLHWLMVFITVAVMFATFLIINFGYRTHEASSESWFEVIFCTRVCLPTH